VASNLVITPEAEQDVNDAFDWYERRRPGLGDEFLRRVGDCLHSICVIPKGRRLVHANYRRAVVQRFPYVVFYEYSEADDTVTVYSVFHTSQDPKKWRDRLP